MRMKSISDNGINLLKTFEGFSAKVYLDTAGKPTIGYGTLIDDDSEKWLLTAVIDEPTAIQLLRTDVHKAETAINDHVQTEITQNQFDALVCFVYNVGIEAFEKSSMLGKININPNNPLIRDKFFEWCHIKGVVSNALLERRRKESVLYFTR